MRKQTHKGLLQSNNKVLEDHTSNQQTFSNSTTNANEGGDTLKVKQALRERDAMVKQLREAEQRLADNQKRVEQKYLHDQHLERSLDLTTDSNDSGVGTPSEEEISLEDINALDEDGYASLHYAAADNNKELVKHLIESGANVNVQGKNGFTPLHYAAANNCLETQSYLIKNQANVNVQDRAKHTPLYYAIANDNKKSAEHLIKHGADRSLIKDEDLINRLGNYAEVAPSHSKTNDVMEIQKETEKAKELRVKLKKLRTKLEGKQKELKEQMQGLEKVQKELAEEKNRADEYETRLKACHHKLDEENKSLRRKVKELENDLSSKLNKAKMNEVPLKRAVFKAASINFVTTLAILSIASGLPVLSIIAASIVSALIAGGITYVVKPTTRLKEADISRGVLDNKNEMLGL